VDLESCEVALPGGGTERFEVDPFSRHCMLNGLDPLGHLLEHLPAIQRYEGENPPRVFVPVMDPNSAEGGAA